MAITQEENQKGQADTVRPACVCSKICAKSEYSRMQNAALESLKAEMSSLLVSWGHIG